MVPSLCQPTHNARSGIPRASLTQTGPCDTISCGIFALVAPAVRAPPSALLLIRGSARLHRLGLGLGFRCGSDHGTRLRRWCWWWRRLETRCSLGRPLPDLCLTLHVTVRRLCTSVFPGVLSAYFPILLSLAQDGAVGIHKNVVGLFYRARYRGRLLDDLLLSDSPVDRISWSRHVGFASRLASRFRREYFITLHFLVQSCTRTQISSDCVWISILAAPTS